MNSSQLILIAAAYLMGSIPTGIVVARLSGKADPRSAGSGNIGATNVSRTLGKGAGFVTLLGDAAKGAFPVAFAAFIMPGSGVFLTSLVGLSAFFGHLFPVFLAFRGGKGVATALGIMVVISPLATLFCAIIFIIIVAVTKYVSLGSIAASVAMPVFLGLVSRRPEYVPLGAAIATLIIIKHRANIKRLKKGTESKFR